MNYRKIGAAAGFSAPIVAFLLIFTAIASYPGFSWTDNALSDLGVVPGLTSALFTAGLIGGGILGMAFAVLGIYSYAGEKPVGKLGAAFFGAATFALVCIGVFNENFGATHFLVSAAFFVFAPIAFFILTAAFYLNRQRRLAALTAAVGAIAAMPWILQYTIHYVPEVAIPEAVSGLAVAIWVFALAILMLKLEG